MADKITQKRVGEYVKLVKESTRDLTIDVKGSKGSKASKLAVPDMVQHIYDQLKQAWGNMTVVNSVKSQYKEEKDKLGRDNVLLLAEIERLREQLHNLEDSVSTVRPVHQTQSVEQQYHDRALFLNYLNGVKRTIKSIHPPVEVIIPVDGLGVELGGGQTPDGVFDTLKNMYWQTWKGWFDAEQRSESYLERVTELQEQVPGYDSEVPVNLTVRQRQAENEQLKQQLAGLTAENQQLKAQLASVIAEAAKAANAAKAPVAATANATANAAATATTGPVRLVPSGYGTWALAGSALAGGLGGYALANLGGRRDYNYQSRKRSPAKKKTPPSSKKTPPSSKKKTKTARTTTSQRNKRRRVSARK